MTGVSPTGNDKEDDNGDVEALGALSLLTGTEKAAPVAPTHGVGSGTGIVAEGVEKPECVPATPTTGFGSFATPLLTSSSAKINDKFKMGDIPVLGAIVKLLSDFQGASAPVPKPYAQQLATACVLLVNGRDNKGTFRERAKSPFIILSRAQGVKERALAGVVRELADGDVHTEMQIGPWQKLEEALKAGMGYLDKLSSELQGILERWETVKGW